MVEFDVGHGNVRQIQLKRLPMPAVIERDEHPEFRARVKQPFAIGIFAHHARRPIGWNSILAVSQTGPGLAIVVRAINVRLIIAEQITIRSVIGRAFAVGRWFDVLDASAFGKVFRRHVGPRLRIVARDIKRPVVGSGPDHAFLERRFSDRIQS